MSKTRETANIFSSGTVNSLVGTLTGDVTGDVTGTATGLSGSPNITINNLTGVAATFTGVLTYEDVTNIDSIGVVTARSGVHVTGVGASVGIGTDNPLQKLHIVDDTSANIYLETKNSSTGSTSGIYFRTSDSSTQDAFFKTAIVLEDDGTSFARGKLHILQENTADNSNATISDSVVTIDQSGRLLVGTTSSSGSHILEVNSGTDNEGIKVVSTDGGSYIRFADNSTTAQIRLGAVGNDFKIDVNASERLRITSAGKFGFGTNNPQGTVHISSGTSGDATLILEADTDNNQEADNPYIVFRQDGGVSASAIGHGVDSGVDGNGLTIANSISSGFISFATGTTNGYTNATERLRISSSGNVGIGTTNPQEKLHVSGTSDFVVDTDSSALRFGSHGEYDIALVTGRNTPTGSSRLYIENGDGEALRITSSGNIGIGEGSPSAILHVTKAGDPNIIQENSANNSLDRNNTHSFQYSDGEGAFVKATRPSSGSKTDTYLAFGSGGSTERVRIDSSGRLLIGTTTEGNELADNLTVADTGNCGITIRSGSSSYGSIYFSDATSGGGEYAGQIEYLHSADRFTFYAGVSAIMRVHSDKVDILGHTETDTLNVSGVSTFANTISVAETIQHTGDTNTSISFPSNDYIRLTTSGSSRLNATPNGYILLGTNSEPSGGDAHARNARLLIHGRVGNAADSGRINLQRGSSASNGSSIGSLTFTDNGNNAYARIETLADAAPGTDDYPGRIVFSTTPDGSASPTEKVRIDSNGDVGIGIADPQERLHVARTVMVTGNTPQIRLNANDSDASDGDRTMLGQATGNGNFVTTAVDNDTILRGTSTGSLLFGIGTVERFRIASTGNIGINKTSPAEKLDVGGITKTEGLNVTGTSSFTGAMTANGNINMFSAAPQFIMKEDGSTYGSTHWALVRDSDSFSIRWNNAAPYALRATTSGGSVGSVFLRQSQLEVNASGAVIQGSLSKGSGSFKIDHPLVGMSTTHNLVHSFIEGPQADLIYRGKVDLVNGSATVNIDTAGRMTEGTFVALCTNVQCFTTNETDWTAIKGSVSGNTLTVLAQDSSCTATVSWMVVGERKDQHMIDTNWTDDNGRVITEPPKTD